MAAEFFDCGGCGHWHPFGWGGDCRNDSMRYTTDRVEDVFGDYGEGWIEVCEFCESTEHSSLEHEQE